jgi:hypothetical protein
MHPKHCVHHANLLLQIKSVQALHSPVSLSMTLFFCKHVLHQPLLVACTPSMLGTKPMILLQMREFDSLTAMPTD